MSKLPNAPIVPRWKTIRGIFRFVQNPIPYLEKYRRMYGDHYILYMGGLLPTLVVTDPGLIQYVLQKNNRNYEKSAIQTQILSDYVGNGLLTSQGAYWLRQRRLIQPGFHRKKLAALKGVMQDEISQFFDAFDDKLKTTSKQEVNKAMMELAFRVVARSLFSTGIDEHQIKTLDTLITRVQGFLIKQVRQPHLSWWYSLSGLKQKHLNYAQEMRDMIGELIRKRQSGEIAREDDLLQMLIDSRYEDTGEPMSMEQLIDESVILFVAGHETTANSLSWIWYLLDEYPELKDQLSAEHNAVCPTAPPTVEQLRELPLSMQFIEESMRLYPPAWITDRVPLEDDEYNGIRLPKGTLLSLYIYGVHHHPDYWSDPGALKPERFSLAAKKDQTPFSYLPFGGGPRLCIGNHFALMEIQLVLVEMLKRYKWRVLDKEKIFPQPMVTLRPANGIWAEIHPE